MSPDRSSLSLPSEASDSLSRPACKDGDELSARMAIVKKYFGGDRAASCISGINHCRAMSGECSFCIGACSRRPSCCVADRT